MGNKYRLIIIIGHPIYADDEVDASDVRLNPHVAQELQQLLIP